MSRPEASTPAQQLRHQQPNWQRRLVIVVSGVAVLGLCIMLRNTVGTSSAEAQNTNPFRGNRPQQAAATQQSAAPAQKAAKPQPATPQPAAAQGGVAQPASAGRPQHNVMAVVNGQDIRRDALASACVDRFGEQVLEGLVNKRLILHHCRNRNIEVTEADLDAEIDRMAARFKLGREQLLKDVIERERGVNEAQFKHDILWPMIAIRKVAADQLDVTDEQVQKAYAAQFGPAVKCRLIVVDNRQLADQLHRQLTSRPDDFARLAMQHSVDVNSASIGGMIQPIRRHVGDPAIEREVFALQPEQISSVIPVGEQFAILKCEGQLAARDVPLENVRQELVDRIKEEKLRDVASQKFAELQASATVQNVWNNPQLRAQNPGVVATINGEPIRYQELGEACLLRYGEEVLDIEISHMLLQQALKKNNQSISQQEMNAEIAHAAKLAGVVDAQGRPDIEKWIQVATAEQGVSKDVYLRDSVWPSAALKKLAGATIQITPDDLKKGFEANYGERVRCRAIVLGNMRRAQEVWAKARQNTSPEYFGDLAEEYSIEPTSKSLRGEVPPIRRFGGQPALEDVAFGDGGSPGLQPGELSGIIQLGDKFVILKCEGRTKPVDVNPQDVRDVLHQDIFEKKLRMAMATKFDEIRTMARIDNFLAGTSQAPERVKPTNEPAAPRVDTAVRPAAGPAAPPR